MYKCIHRFVIILLALQSVPAVIYSQVSKASVEASFENYGSKAIQEKLFLHTDKEFYLAGEILWFRLYYVFAATQGPADLSKLAYVEVLNNKGESVLQAKISLAAGESSGSFYLPASFNTGYYTLRAYTNWMKNFDQAYFFEKKITVLNTVKRPEPIPAADSLPAVAAFFPEGGNLVSGIQSRVGVMVKNSNGRSPVYHGYVLDNNNDTVAQFAPLKFGIGSFDFTPLPGNNYKAIISFPDGTSISSSLPGVYSNGYVMKVKERNADQLAITIYHKRMPDESNSARVILAAHTRQALVIVENAGMSDNDSIIFLIDKKRLRKGITHFTLLNENGSPLCERLFYSKPLQRISLVAETDKNIYDQRQKIDLSIKAGNTGSGIHSLDLSASVFYLDSLQSISPSMITDYMWLASDLTGNIESPGYYFSNDTDVAQATDNLMITQGWRKFNWKDVLLPSNSFVKYLPEIHGQLITGIIKSKITGKPVPGVFSYLSVTGRPFGFYTSVSDGSGMVYFEVKDYYGNKQVIPQVVAQGDSLSIEILKPYVPAADMKYAAYIPDEDQRDQILKRSIGMQVQNVYLADSLRNFDEPRFIDTLPFFGIGEKLYKLDNYTRFTTMEEVLREYVGEIGVGAKGGKLIFKMYNPTDRYFYNGGSLVLLDGVPLQDENKIFQYNPLNVKNLEVITRRYVLGRSMFNGIASFTTYDGQFDGFELDPKLVSIDYAGLQLQREFYSPVYETREQVESRMPDFRNTLIWSPYIHITGGKASLQFYSSDLPGKYAVVVQGMSSSGEFVSTIHSFEVK